MDVKNVSAVVWKMYGSGNEEKKYAYPKYPDECVLCYQCEMDCLNNVIDIQVISALQVDPLEYSAELMKKQGE